MQGCGSTKRESKMQSPTSETEYTRKASVRFVQDAIVWQLPFVQLISHSESAFCLVRELHRFSVIS